MSPTGQQTLPQQTELGAQSSVIELHGAAWQVPFPQ
jgi:hypothetical protein